MGRNLNERDREALDDIERAVGRAGIDDYDRARLQRVGVEDGGEGRTDEACFVFGSNDD